MKKKRTWLISSLCLLAGLVFFFLIWWIISLVLHSQGNVALPYPNEVGLGMVEMLFGSSAKTTYEAVGWTLARLIIGFTVSFILGAILGTIAGLFNPFEKFMKPFIIICRSVPTAAIVIILVVLLIGIKGWPTYIPSFLVFLVAFPLIYQAFEDGIRSEPADEKDALKLDGGDRSVKAIVHVLWPDSQNYILLAIAQSLGLSMKVSVMSEILCDSSNSATGIGILISDARTTLGMKEIIGYSFIAVILIAIIDIPLQIMKRKLKDKE
jgi:ABC-type nitrate/sulfonate/bicarbonate transport system permease component